MGGQSVKNNAEYPISKQLLIDPGDEDSITEIEREIDRLVKAYYEKKPDEELPYIAEANIYIGREPVREWEVLQNAITKLDNCPRCYIRYAGLILTRQKGDYARAAENLEYSGLIINRDLDFGYAQYLRGLCLIRSELKDDYCNRDKIDRIYQCFRLAQKSDEYRDKIYSEMQDLEKQINILETLSRIEFPRD